MRAPDPSKDIKHWSCFVYPALPASSTPMRHRDCLSTEEWFIAGILHRYWKYNGDTITDYYDCARAIAGNRADALGYMVDHHMNDVEARVCAERAAEVLEMLSEFLDLTKGMK